MKKLLFIAMICVMSVGVFAKEKVKSNFQCTAHLYRTVFSSGHEYSFYVEITGSTCEAAMAAAKNVADEVTEAL